jgi:hypothetical protein
MFLIQFHGSYKEGLLQKTSIHSFDVTSILVLTITGSKLDKQQKILLLKKLTAKSLE